MGEFVAVERSRRLLTRHSLPMRVAPGEDLQQRAAGQLRVLVGLDEPAGAHTGAKPGPLNAAERSIMSQHSYETYEILRHIDGIEDIARWAAYHHETLTGEGYPFHRGGAEMSEEARIVAVADVFQALAQERPYRRSLEPAEILRILREMAEAGRLDPSLVDLAAQNAEACWEAAMNRGGVPS